MDYKKNITVNQYKLDQEWLEQPGWIEEVNRAWADAVLTRNRAKEQLEVVYAEMDLKIRKDIPTDLVNPKEASFKNYIIASKDYQEAVEKFLQTEHQVNVLQAGCKAFSAKGDALKSLTQLLLADRYSNPSSPPEKELQAKGIETGTATTSDRLESSGRLHRKPIPKS